MLSVLKPEAGASHASQPANSQSQIGGSNCDFSGAQTAIFWLDLYDGCSSKSVVHGVAFAAYQRVEDSQSRYGE